MIANETRTSGGTSAILPAERKKATFDIEKLTNLLDGGPEMTKKRRFILSPTKNLSVSQRIYLSRPEQFKLHLQHLFKTHEAYWDFYQPSREELVWMSENSMFTGTTVHILHTPSTQILIKLITQINHYGLFIATISGQCTEEQKKWWLDRARKMKIFGSYCQTELGHGSNVRGILCSAVYDKNTQEFVLNTPTLRSIKWWPGAQACRGPLSHYVARLLI